MPRDLRNRKLRDRIRSAIWRVAPSSAAGLTLVDFEPFLDGGFMTGPIILASSALAVVLVLALVREVRLRRALQALLRRLLEKWRSDTNA